MLGSQFLVCYALGVYVLKALDYGQEGVLDLLHRESAGVVVPSPGLHQRAQALAASLVHGTVFVQNGTQETWVADFGVDLRQVG